MVAGPAINISTLGRVKTHSLVGSHGGSSLVEFVMGREDICSGVVIALRLLS